MNFFLLEFLQIWSHICYSASILVAVSVLYLCAMPLAKERKKSIIANAWLKCATGVLALSLFQMGK